MQYYERNQQALRAEQDTLDRKANEWGSSAEMLFLQPGMTMVRVLPPYSDKGIFFHKIVKHTLRVGNQTEVFVCPAAFGLPCPICAKGEELTASRDEKKMEFARTHLRPRERYLYNVLCYSAPPDRLGAVPEFGRVLVMETGIMVHRKIISLDQDAQTGWADITNLENGVVLIIKRTGKGQYDTTYNVNPHGDGRTNLVAECQARNVDVRSLQLVNLEQVYTLAPDWKLEQLADSIDKVVNANFGAAPSLQPVLPTVSPTAAAAAPVAPVASAPVPAAAPVPQGPPNYEFKEGQQPQNWNLPFNQPVTPAQPGPLAVPPQQSGEGTVPLPPQVPVVPPPPGYVAPQGPNYESNNVHTPPVGDAVQPTTSGPPQPPVIPAPPDDNEGKVPF